MPPHTGVCRGGAGECSLCVAAVLVLVLAVGICHVGSVNRLSCPGTVGVTTGDHGRAPLSCLYCPHPPTCRHQVMGAIRGLAVAPDQASLFVTGGADRKLCWWDTRQAAGPLHVVQEAHGGEVACVAFSSSGTLLASGGADKVGTSTSCGLQSLCPWRPATSDISAAFAALCHGHREGCKPRQ